MYSIPMLFFDFARHSLREVPHQQQLGPRAASLVSGDPGGGSAAVESVGAVAWIRWSEGSAIMGSW